MKQKSKTLAAVLAFVLGWLGIHRFYVGKVGSGVAMLLLSMTLVGLMGTVPWALVDAMKIILGRFEDGKGNPLA
jgi:TM2 domain-containing membrane protein YozV